MLGKSLNRSIYRVSGMCVGVGSVMDIRIKKLNVSSYITGQIFSC